LERYSDSLAAYVLLDTNNVSVYKQLYRAAKAKLKLKLRVNINANQEPAAVGRAESTIAEEEFNSNADGHRSKHASVEDHPELAPQKANKQQKQEHESPLISLTPDPQPLYDLEEALNRLESTMNLTEATERMKQEQTNITKNLDILEASVNALSNNMGNLTLCGNSYGMEQMFATQQAVQCPFRPMQASPAAPTPVLPASSCATGIGYAVCCNICDKTIPDAHYHCGTCDDGDFDLCLECVQKGETCRMDDHWLIKRQVKDGVFVNSTTVKLSRKQLNATPQPFPTFSDLSPTPALAEKEQVVPTINKLFYHNIRTCNCCVRELPESEFVHCTVCEDFDLCKACFKEDKHGHHPKHAFVPAVKGSVFPLDITERMAPGRGQAHNAYCDDCDKRINGVRHKCLDCPDWDYCNDCFVNARFIHPGHRFAPIYEHIEPAPCVNARAKARPMHVGIKCDGPLCQDDSGYIRGVRYKCAVCDDTDYCENCEASPVNTHNKTHPLIKFKTPVKYANVTTTGAHGNGRPMPVMGDKKPCIVRCGTNSRATETTVKSEPKQENKPLIIKKEIKEETEKTEIVTIADVKPIEEKLSAVYVHDLVADGTVLPPNYLFVQKWTLRNEGTVVWPVGCRVTVDRKSGCGDYHGALDPTRATSVRELEASGMSNATKSPVAPGAEMDFHVTLRTPLRQGRSISYWRLTTPDGKHFGNRLWTDVNVQILDKPQSPIATTDLSFAEPAVKEELETVIKEEEAPVIKEEQIAEADVKLEDVGEADVKLEEDKDDAEPEAELAKSVEVHESQMIFPKLDKESPISSIHQEQEKEQHIEEDNAQAESPPAYEEEYEECNEDDEWAVEDDDSNGFLTDDEYDVLDASDEEYLEEQQKKLLKK
jgi:next-to-BRCA1 protein 1